MNVECPQEFNIITIHIFINYTEIFAEDDLYADLSEMSNIEILMSSFDTSLSKVMADEHGESYVNLQRTGNLDATNTANKLYTGKLSADPGL